VETIVFNLTNNIDVVETNRSIEQYKKDNKEHIEKSKSRRKEVVLELDEILEQEKLRTEMLRVEILNMEKAEKIRRLKTHEALIDDLMFSDVDAKSIVATHKSMKSRGVEQETDVGGRFGSNNGNGLGAMMKDNQAPTVSFTSGIGFGAGRSTFLPVPMAEEIPLFFYQELHLDLGGLDPPTKEELKESHSKYLNHIKAATPAEIAGGFHSSISCRRALQDAFADISFQPKLIQKLEEPELPVELEESELMDMDTS
jgi:CDK-activating kinase assembly factor MAT1